MRLHRPEDAGMKAHLVSYIQGCKLSTQCSICLSGLSAMTKLGKVLDLQTTEPSLQLEPVCALDSLNSLTIASCGSICITVMRNCARLSRSKLTRLVVAGVSY